MQGGEAQLGSLDIEKQASRVAPAQVNPGLQLLLLALVNRAWPSREHSKEVAKLIKRSLNRLQEQNSRGEAGLRVEEQPQGLS